MSRSRDVLIGLTGLVGIGGLAATLLLLGELQLGGSNRYGVFLLLDNAAGITPGAPVTLNGVVVGRVDVTLTNVDPRAGVRLELRIDEGVKVPRDVEVLVTRDLVGNSTLALQTVPLPPEGDPGFLEPGETMSASARDILDEIASLLDSRLAAFSRAAEAVQQLASTYTRVGERLEELLGDERSEETVARALGALRELESGIAEARRWLGDDELRQDISRAARRAGETIDQADATLARIGEAAGTVEQRSTQVAESFDEAVGSLRTSTVQLNATLLEIQTLTARINAGEGTVGRLVTDPDLYRSINDAAIRLEKMLREAQLLLEKYRTEGIPIRL